MHPGEEAPDHALQQMVKIGGGIGRGEKLL
jgi:hypothetical protein